MSKPNKPKGASKTHPLANLHPLLDDDLIVHALKTETAKFSLRWHVEHTLTFDRICEIIKRNPNSPFMTRQYPVYDIHYEHLRVYENATALVTLILGVQLTAGEEEEDRPVSKEQVQIMLPGSLLSKPTHKAFNAWYQETSRQWRENTERQEQAMLRRLVKQHPVLAAQLVSARVNRSLRGAIDRD